MGVYYNNQKRRWVARSKAVKGKREYIGAYKTEELAQGAYKIHELAKKMASEQRVGYMKYEHKEDPSFGGNFWYKLSKLFRRA